MRHSVVGQIYGYLICLVAVLLFIHSIAGIVNGAFGASGPAPFARFGHGNSLHARGAFGWQGGMMQRRWVLRQGALLTPQPGMLPGTPPTGARVAVLIHHGSNIRGIVLNVVLLLVALLLFATHWRWLERGQPSTA